MKTAPNSAGGETSSSFRWIWLVLAGGVLIALIMLLRSSRPSEAGPGVAEADAPASDAARYSRGGVWHYTAPRPAASQRRSAAEAQGIVANKLKQFVQNRHELLRAYARHLKTEVPPEMDAFFAAAEAGSWDDLRAQFEALNKLRMSDKEARPESFADLWPAVVETYGVAEQVRARPAQKLLDYGEAVLGSLRPGMVYLGGTDSGRFIPTLLNETAEGERHVVLTQNAFADGSYLGYVRFLYGEQLAALTPEDSQRAFQAYLADAQQRLRKNELRPGEDVRMVGEDPANQRLQVSGQVAVMAINERLLQTLMAKNPDTSFALEESFPMKSTYAEASPLGPLMELRARDGSTALSAEQAGQSLDYWQTTARQLLVETDAASSQDALNAYSKMAAGQAALLAEHHHTSEAEQIYRMAIELSPGNPEAVFRFVSLLLGQNRPQDALPVVQSAVAAAPANQQLRDLLGRLEKTPTK